MNKRELIASIVKRLQDAGVRRHVPVQRSKLYISDGEGNKSLFTIRKPSTDILLSSKEVAAVIETFADIVEENMTQGERTTVKGLGAFDIVYRRPKRVKHPVTGEICNIPGKYAPKFDFAGEIKRAVKYYDMEHNVDDEAAQRDDK